MSQERILSVRLIRGDSSLVQWKRVEGKRLTESDQMAVFVSQRAVGPVTILELGEQLKAENVSEFRDTLQHLVEQGHRHLLLDCSRIRIVDSQGIGSLVGNWISIKKRGGKLGLLNPPVRLQDVLRIIGLQRVIESFDDIGKALPSLAE